MTTNDSTSVAPKIEESWKIALADEFEADYFKNLVTFVKEETRKHTIYPAGKNIFSAFNGSKGCFTGSGSLSWAGAGTRVVFFGARWGAVSTFVEKYF